MSTKKEKIKHNCLQSTLTDLYQVYILNCERFVEFVQECRNCTLQLNASSSGLFFYTISKQRAHLGAPLVLH